MVRFGAVPSMTGGKDRADASPDPIEWLQLEGGATVCQPGKVCLSWRLRVIAASAARGCGMEMLTQPVPPAPSGKAAHVSCARVTQRLRRLLSFQREAASLRSVDRWPTLPESDDASVTTSIL